MTRYINPKGWIKELNLGLNKYKGRGAVSNQDSRYLEYSRESMIAECDYPEEPDDVFSNRPKTEIFIDTSRKIITRNQSPDVPFDQSINPYKGCEHGCSYCFARPTHAYLDLSPGLDFETKIFAKPNAAALLKRELSNPNYKPATIAIGANTDPYQPIERKLGITRKILEVCEQFNQPIGIITKSSLIERDIDILGCMAQHNLVQVAVSVTSLSSELSRKMEPRASAPHSRLNTINKLTEAGVHVCVLFAPIIPALNDSELEKILSTCHDAGAQSAGYVLLRLPLEVKELFIQWLQTHYPLKAKHVISIIKNLHEGRHYTSEWGTRQRGTGAFAALIAQRFDFMCKKLKFNQREYNLNLSKFCNPEFLSHQLVMF